MERRKQSIMKRDAGRSLVTVICIALLVVVVCLSMGRAVKDMFGEAQNSGKVVRAEVKQQKIRYRFRRIYHGGDVMTANHNAGGMPAMSFRSTSVSPAAAGSTSPAVTTGSSRMSGYSAPAAGSFGTVGVLQSQQHINSYGGGGGMSGGVSSGTSGGSGMGGATYSGSGVAVPSLATLPSFNGNRSAVASAVSVLAANTATTPSAGPVMRKVSVNVWNDEEEEWDVETWDADNTAPNGTTHTLNGITYTKVDGKWQYTDEGGNDYVWDEETSNFVLASTLPETDYPIGATPWLLMLLLAALFTAWKYRSSRQSDSAK